MDQAERRLLSRMLFESREQLSMWRDVVERRSGKRDEWARLLIEEIDRYRDAKGWSPHGYGDE